jgi:hypothetical protein
MKITDGKNIPDEFFECIDFESIPSVNEIIKDVKAEG